MFGLPVQGIPHLRSNLVNSLESSYLLILHSVQRPRASSPTNVCSYMKIFNYPEVKSVPRRINLGDELPANENVLPDTDTEAVDAQQRL